VSIRIGRIALAFLVLALAAGSVAIPAGAEHGGAVVAKSKCKKKKAKRAAAAKKKKKCKRGGAGGAATSLPGQKTNPNVTLPVTTPPVTTPALKVSGVSIVDNPILGSRSTQGQVTINGVAPAGGQPVTLVSSNPSRAKLVPSSVQVAQGQTTANFSVETTTGPTVTATVTASIGASSKHADLKVVQEPSVEAVTLAYKCFPDVGLVNFGTNRVTLDVPAAADSSVALSSSSTPPGALTLPSAVTVPAGSSSATFGVNTVLPVDSPPGVAVTGSLTGAFGTSEATSAPSSIRSDLSPAPVVASVSATPTSVAPDSTTTGTVTLNCEAPSPGGTSVTLSSDNPDVTVTPSPVVVPADKLSKTFTINVEADAAVDSTAHIGVTPSDPSSPRATLTIVDDIQIQ
jgi:hypothetical protein